MFEKQIARGMQLLDEKCPGWQEQIDLSILNMGSTYCCVLGQVFADDCENASDEPPYFKGVEAIIPEEYVSVSECGFTVEYSTNEEWMCNMYTQLTNEWKEVIREKKGTTGIAEETEGDSEICN